MKKDSRTMDLDKTLIMAVTAVMAFPLDKVSARKSDTVDTNCIIAIFDGFLLLSMYIEVKVPFL